MEESNIIIKIRDLHRSFEMAGEELHVLKGISLDIMEGEFVTIMGASGSGKSTLLNILGCLDQASSGLYELAGERIKNMTKDQLAEVRSKKIGFIFQSYNLLPRTSALENVELPLFYNPSVSGEERKKRSVEALKMIGLEDRMTHTPSQLSGGQQQRVAIARSLVNNPKVIFADEATGNLDTKTSYEIMSVFQDLNRRGKTIVFVTHEPDIAEFSSRTIVIRDGRIIKDYKNNNIKDANIVLADYLKTLEDDENS
ncbi:MAG: ABC transporter ATP-binding protein [Saprospiraceae bacterium]